MVEWRYHHWKVIFSPFAKLVIDRYNLGICFGYYRLELNICLYKQEITVSKIFGRFYRKVGNFTFQWIGLSGFRTTGLMAHGWVVLLIDSA